MNLYAKIIIALFVIFNFGQPLFSQEPGLTIFGTDQISSEKIQERYANDLDQLKISYDTNRALYGSLKTVLEKDLIKLGDFSYANVRIFRSYSNTYSFILDFVETDDTVNRLNFRTIKTESFDDPDSLLAKWDEYETLSFELFNQGEIADYSCPVIHCLWSFNHPKLKPFQTYFQLHVPENKGALIEILNASDSPSQRASAAFLLAHAEMSNQDLLMALMPSFRDSSSIVRNNSMRVVYYIARAHPEMTFDISEIVNALDYPSFTDRNKALVILRSIPLDNLSDENAKRLVTILLEVLEKKDAHNYKNAHLVIKKLSAQNFGTDEINRWKNWANAYLENK